MPLTILYLRETPVAAREKRPLPLSSLNLRHGYFPARGVPFSIMFHALLVVGYIFLPPLPAFLKPIAPPEKVVMLDLHDPEVMMYLPELIGGTRGTDLPEKKSQDSIKAPSLPASGGSKGLSYPGPQRIISNPPEPTNEIQTVLQPDIENPPILIPPVPLPNIVQIAEASPAVETNSNDTAERLQKSVPKESAPEQQPPAEPPRELAPPIEEEASFVMPTLPPLEMERSLPLEESPMVVQLSPPPPEPIPESKPKEPVAKPVEKPKTEAKREMVEEPKKSAEQKPATKPEEKIKTDAKPATVEEPKKPAEPETSAQPTNGTDAHTLIALTPMPAQSEQKFEVPVGEARGRFAISPEPNLDTTETTLGSNLSGLETPSPTPAIGSSTTAPPGNEASGNATVAILPSTSTNGGAGSSNQSSGIGSGSAAGVNSGSGATTGSGSAAGAGSGSGSGSGAGSGKSAFSGITIIGGAKPSAVSTANSGSSIKILKSSPKPIQSSYGLTVISTEGSGGGLPPFGVFSQERIYTVFLDMRKTETDTVPKWTLEFAVLRKPEDQGETASSSARSQQGLVLPFPIVKIQPTLPAELVRRYLQKMIIVYAVIDVAGKMEQISVKDSPDAMLNEPVINALSQWTFRPASLSGEPVAVKALIGIPLSPPQ
jgi:hypothetical protein